MAEKDPNIFDECVAECVHMCPQKEECTSSSWGDSKMCTPGTIENLQRMPNKKKQKRCCSQSKNFSGTSDTISHLKTFRTISNELPVLLLILCWWYFTCL